MYENIIFKVSVNDNDTINEIANKFDGAKIVKTAKFIGGEILVDIIVPVVSSSIPFVINYIKEAKKESKDISISINGIKFYIPRSNVQDVVDVLKKIEGA